jgi:GTPase SAR1 family protein
MGTAKIKINPAMQLGSPESQFRLNQIDKIRAKGVGDHVSLPQIAVCGDQSTGKSSVMERLTHIPFPRRDGICTRFATEIILRHSDGPRQIVASIRADTSRKPESQEILQGYRKIMSDFSDLPAIIEEVSALMGLRSVENPNGSAFALDALRIEVSGSTGLHLTIVDLPGLISVPNEEQSDEDVEMVHRLVESYLQSSRTIILAVVQAGNDIANQPILRKAREFDPNGLRTVGIITKPDLINDGTEYQIARLVNNEGNVKLKLGFFILKNPSPKDMEAGYNAETFDRIESTFFAQTAWRRHAIHTDRVGISKLKEFVQVLLHEHIEREIPKVREELKKKLFDLELKQKGLGKARPTLNDIRSFLTERSMRFHQLAQDSLQGHYLGSEADFFQHETRLRALVHRENFTFAENMRVEGSKRIVVESKPSSSSDSIDESIDDRQTEQIKVTQKEMLNWVKEVSILFMSARVHLN